MRREPNCALALAARQTHPFKPSVVKAGVAAMRWHHQNEGRPTPTAAMAVPPPYNAAEAARARALIARLGLTQAEVASACGVKAIALSCWLGGRDTHTPGVLKAGAAAMRWHQKNKDRPTPVATAEPPPYNAADAARVGALIARLGMTQRGVASACGANQSALSDWLGGRHTRKPSVLKAGAAAMRWHHENKGRLV